MILKRLLFLCLPLSLLLSCLNSTEDECSTVLCDGGQRVLGFEIIQDGENVFDIGTYNEGDVVIDDSNTQIAIEFISNIEDRPALLIQDPDWSSGTYDYVVELGDDSFTISPTFELSDESECCGRVLFLTSIEVNDVEINLAEVTGVFTVNL